jgi:hypothetical protein
METIFFITVYKSQFSKKDFVDYIIKAENGIVARELAKDEYMEEFPKANRQKLFAIATGEV